MVYLKFKDYRLSIVWNKPYRCSTYISREGRKRIASQVQNFSDAQSYRCSKFIFLNMTLKTIYNVSTSQEALSVAFIKTNWMLNNYTSYLEKKNCKSVEKYGENEKCIFLFNFCMNCKPYICVTSFFVSKLWIMVLNNCYNHYLKFNLLSISNFYVLKWLIVQFL